MTKPIIPFDATVTLVPDGRASGAGGERRYLLVFEGSSSRVVPIPDRGELMIGRAPEVEVRVDDPAASRQHARIVVDGSEVMLVDLGSRNGTLVNGERVAGGRPLRRGDVVAIGSTSIVVHRDAGGRVARPLMDERLLRARAEEEIGRLARHPQVLAVACLRVADGAFDRAAAEGALARELRLVDAAAWGDGVELLLLVPEVEEEPAETVRRVVGSLGPSGKGVRAGIAQYPMDGGDVDTLLAMARAAAAEAKGGEIRGADDIPSTRMIGTQTVVVLEPSMARIYALLERLAKSALPVLVTGETGTGKEHAAAAIHHGSPRAPMRFVTINCAALPENLVESELFGYERGAFTGAQQPKAGLLEVASGGTLFLDEIGELSLGTQAKLLRVLETRKVTPVGGLTERDVDVRVVAATNRDLVEEVEAGRFRRDLLYRLGAATVVLPPLRDRRREIPVLARRLLIDACARAARPPLAIAPLAMQRLLGHGWPGNVRELRNVMDYVAATSQGPAVEAWDLPELLDARVATPAQSLGPAAARSPGDLTFRPLADEIRELEKRRIQEAMSAAGGVQTKAAELIGMPVRTLFGKLKLHGIAPQKS